MLLWLPGVACQAPAGSVSQHTFHGGTMGTTYAVTVVGQFAEPELARLEALVGSTLADIDAKMSTYDADSEVSRFNRFDAAEWFRVSPETFRVIETAQTVSRLTGGAFDVTVGPLVDAWGFGPSGEGSRLPTPDEVEALRAGVGYTGLDLSPAESSLRKSRPDLAIDLSAVAKGYGVDRVAHALDEQGLEAYLIEVGGEVRTRGRRADGRPWRVGIEQPTDGASRLQRVVELSDAALATSGDYRNYIEHEGRRYSHTIDPRTGYPVTHRLASASVVDSSCAVADARATALEVLGPEDGYELASSEGWAVLLVIREADGSLTERATPAFDRLAP